MKNKKRKQAILLLQRMIGPMRTLYELGWASYYQILTQAELDLQEQIETYKKEK